MSGSNEQGIDLSQRSFLVPGGYIQAWNKGEPARANHHQHNQKLNKG
jgi:hypothetical protein